MIRRQFLRALGLPPEGTSQDRFVVVAQVGATSFGIAVDRVYDTEEIVVKPIAPILRGTRFYVGNTILGEAITKCVADLGSQLDNKAASVPANVVQVSGLVADASPDGTIIINIGSRAGLKVGDTLDVKRQGRVIRDPATQKVLRSIDDAIGTLTITEVDEGSAVGKLNGGGGPAKVGDVVATAK